MKRIAIAALSTFLAFGTLAGAAERSIDDCEKIAEADAYNQCLARFGPPAKKLGALVKGGVQGSQDSGAQDSGAQDSGQDADAQDGVRDTGAQEAQDEAPAKAGRHRSGHGRYAHGRRHGHGHVYAHRHGHHAHAAQAGGGKSGKQRMAFNTVSNRRAR